MTDVDEFFTGVGQIPYAGPDSDDPLTFRWYDADRVVAGKRMEDHLRFAVCYWHSFVLVGRRRLRRGHLRPPVVRCRRRPPGSPPARQMAAAFEFFAKLGAPFFCFHDRDVAPEGATLGRDAAARLDAMVDEVAGHMARTGVRLLWGTANLFCHPPLRGRRRHQPRSRGLRLRRRPGEHALEATQRARRRQLRPLGRARGLRHAAQHRPAREPAQLGRFIAPGRRAQAPHRLRGARSSSSRSR